VTLAELVPHLLMWLSLNSPYSADMGNLPMIAFVPRQYVCAIGGYPQEHCASPRKGVVAIHDGKKTIFFRYALSNPDNPQFVSTLLHELVHHQQWAYNPKMSLACKEVEAYRIEAKWQKENGMAEDSDPLKLMQYKAACG